MYISNQEYIDQIFKENETLVYADYTQSSHINIGPQPGGANLFLCYFKNWKIGDFPFSIGIGFGITLPTVIPSFQVTIGIPITPSIFLQPINMIYIAPGPGGIPSITTIGISIGWQF